MYSVTAVADSPFYPPLDVMRKLDENTGIPLIGEKGEKAPFIPLCPW